MKITIDCVSDLHGFEPKMPGGDLLIVAGDCTLTNKVPQWNQFFKWFHAQNYRKRIYIGGNHDGFLTQCVPCQDMDHETKKELNEYLCDSGTEFEGLKIWGTPWTPIFRGINTKYAHFMDIESGLGKKFAMIPEGLDILITHGPMQNILDRNRELRPCGSWALREAIDRVMPKFHIFGHIHEDGGKECIYKDIGPNTHCVNVSYVDRDYEETRRFARITIHREGEIVKGSQLEWCFLPE